MHNAPLSFLIHLPYFKLLNRCELDPCVYDVFDSESALELNAEVVTLTSGTLCIPIRSIYLVSFHIICINAECIMYVPNYSYTDFCYLHGIFLVVLLKITRRYASGVPVRARDSLFSAPIQTGPGVHPACCTAGTRALSRVSGSWGVGLSLTPSSAEVLND